MEFRRAESYVTKTRDKAAALKFIKKGMKRRGGGLDAETRRQLRARSVPRNGVPPVGSRVSSEYRGLRRQDAEVGVPYAKHG